MTALDISMNGVALASIKVDPDLQMRLAGVDPAVVTEYAEAMEAGATFPPVTLFYDGSTYWPGDGFHRIEAARRIGRDSVHAEIQHGGRRDAMLFAAGANASHGVRRTQADKRKAIAALLRDPEWAKWSDRAIAKACATDHKTVAKVRRELTGDFPSERAVTYTDRHGNASTMKVTAPETTGSSMVEKMLAKASTEALVAECRRRGLEVAS